MTYITRAYSPAARPARWVSQESPTADAAALTAVMWQAAGCVSITVSWSE
jgi:hypothetical protein